MKNKTKQKQQKQKKESLYGTVQNLLVPCLLSTSSPVSSEGNYSPLVPLHILTLFLFPTILFF